MQGISFAWCNLFCPSFEGFICFFRQDAKLRLITYLTDLYFLLLNNTSKETSESYTVAVKNSIYHNPLPGEFQVQCSLESHRMCWLCHQASDPPSRKGGKKILYS